MLIKKVFLLIQGCLTQQVSTSGSCKNVCIYEIELNTIVQTRRSVFLFPNNYFVLHLLCLFHVSDVHNIIFYFLFFRYQLSISHAIKRTYTTSKFKPQCDKKRAAPAVIVIPVRIVNSSIICVGNE